MLSIIAAMDENYVIGKNNNLIWNLPEDLKRFKDITMTGTKTMIMGRKTFESLPLVLPGRKHIILSANKDYQIDNENVIVIHNIEELKPFIESSEEYFVIGGGKIFSLLLPYSSKMYLTIIHENFEGDTFFPSFNKSEWKVSDLRENSVSDTNQYKHTFMILERL